jgi:hypothetical protein
VNKWILLWLLPSVLFAAEPIVVRSSVEPQQAWQGQRVQLTIEVLGKDAWAQIPNLPVLQVSGAYVLPSESQGVRIQEQIDRAQYTGQRYQLSVYPQRGGVIVIPAISVNVKSSVWGETKEGKGLTQVTLPEVKFSSKVPPAAEGIDWLVSTESFSATQTWSTDATELKVGEALKRKVTLTADNVSGMAFKPLSYPPIQGLGIYPAEATVGDKRQRGSLSGQRSEEVTYVFEGAGVAKVPTLEFVWWDLKNQELKKIVLEGRAVKVTGGSMASYPGASEVNPAAVHIWWYLLATSTLGGIGIWKRKQILATYLAWKTEQAEHEKVYFKHFIETANSGDVLKTQSALMGWLDRINTSKSPAQLGVFLESYIETTCDITTLLGSPTQLVSAITTARKNWIKAQKVKTKADGLLPELNS